MTPTKMEPRQWQKGAVRRLASVCEDILAANTRNAGFVTNVSRALKNSARSLKGRSTSESASATASPSSSTSPSLTASGDTQNGPPADITSPVSARGIFMSNIRTPRTHSNPATESLSKGDDPSVPDLPCVLPLLRPVSPFKLQDPFMPPTPPETPAKGRSGTCADTTSVSANPFAIFSPQPVASEFSPASGSPSSPVAPGYTSVKRSSTSPGRPMSPNLCTPERNATSGSSSRDGSPPFQPADSSIRTADYERLGLSPRSYTTVPRIKVSDYDSTEELASREVSLSSIQSVIGEDTPDSVSPARAPVYALNVEIQAELNAYLAPLRASALRALEDDTATLVDQLRSFVNSLRKLSRNLADLRENAKDNPRLRPSYQNSVKRICTLARKGLDEMKATVYALKEPRVEMLMVAWRGPAVAVLPELLKWGLMSSKEKVEVLYSLIKQAETQTGRKKGGRIELMKELIVAVAEEGANREFLRKVNEWEVEVQSLERRVGGLFP